MAPDFIHNPKYNDIQLTDHFKLSEFRCRCGDKPSTRIYYCGGGVIVPPNDFLIALEKLRSLVGMVLISSAYRCYHWNKFVGGEPKSYHTQFNMRFSKYGAADLFFPEYDKQFKGTDSYWLTLRQVIQDSGFTGIIQYKIAGHCHCDCRPTPYFEFKNKK